MLVMVGSSRFQQGSALLVFLNFVLTVAQSERLPPEDTFEFRLLSGIDIAFTSVKRGWGVCGGGGGGRGGEGGGGGEEGRGRMGASERSREETHWIE